MEGERFLKNSQIIILGVCIAFATIVSTVILSKTLFKIKKFTTEVIDVTGSAEKAITSDYIVWKADISRRADTLADAYNDLKKDLDSVNKYLYAKGINPKDITVSQINTTALFVRNEKGYDTNEVEGYQLNQTIEIKSNDVAKITDISRNATELIDQGIYFFSYQPEYFYTKLDQLKIEMLALAAEDAKKRAEGMLAKTGNKLGVMRSAKMGVFQITSVNSTAVSDYGIYDTYSLEKKVNAVVHVDFEIKE